MADPTTEALTAECEALRLQLRLKTEQAEHYEAEASRLGDMAKDAQRDASRLRECRDTWKAQAESLQVRLESFLTEPDQPD